MFDSYRPATLEEALELMGKKTLIPLAGGTDLMIRARNFQGASRNFKGDVILIAHLNALKGITETEEAYVIGANVTQAEMVASPILPEFVRHVVAEMATPAIRNAATLGGNIVNAASVADTLPILYACDAKLILKSVKGERIVNVEDFVLAKYKTDRHPDELLISIVLPKFQIQSYTYQKMGQRKASILSKVSFLALCTDHDVRIAIGALNDTVLRSKEIEKMIAQKKPKTEILSAYQALYQSHDDKRSTKAYKERVVNNLIGKWLDEKHEVNNG
ncbi:MAG: FAD binding domain-containing protein [Clostridiales bacterium]|nr:FAD binding domain-containing protein [Clostridiales bacterium]